MSMVACAIGDDVTMQPPTTWPEVVLQDYFAADHHPPLGCLVLVDQVWFAAGLVLSPCVLCPHK